MINEKQNLKNKIKALEIILNDTLWMARRYANGRMTSAPWIFRNSYNSLKRFFPNLLPKHDKCIDDDAKQWMKDEITKDDWLIDCND